MNILTPCSPTVLWVLAEGQDGCRGQMNDSITHLARVKVLYCDRSRRQRSRPSASGYGHLYGVKPIRIASASQAARDRGSTQENIRHRDDVAVKSSPSSLAYQRVVSLLCSE
jgi:hypothetical protein